MSKTKTIFRTMILTSAASALPFRLTPIEARAGRILRAPDHDAGTGGGDGGSGGDGSGAGGEGAGVQAGGDPAGGGEGGAGSGGAADQSADGGDAVGGDGAADDGAGDKTILGDAAGDGKDDGSADADGQQGDAPRLQFGEGDEARDILGSPEAYAIEIPAELAAQGMTFDKEVFDIVEPTLRSLNLSNDAAQAIASVYAEKVLPALMKRGDAAADAMGADMRRTWTEEATRAFDGREGRPPLAEVKALCKQAFLAGGVKSDSPFLKLLEDTGFGSHPDMIRTMAHFGRLAGEATVDPGSGGGDIPVRPADKIYGKPTPRDG